MAADTNPWYKLDNAAKIYPAARRRDWTALFRVSATLTEPVDLPCLERALGCTLHRFPTFSVRLCRGVFWFYLEHTDDMPDLQPDVGNPCVRMDFRENKRFLFRVRYHENRIALEVFHVLADGTGGLTFLRTLVAEYLRIRYGAVIPRSPEILDCTEAPRPDEAEDAYLKYAGRVTRSRRETDAFFIQGTDEPPDVIHITTGQIPVAQVLQKAKEKGVTLTEYLTAVLILSADALQRRRVKRERHLKPVKICVPVNLRAFYPTHTLRNFALYVNPGIEPNLGRYSFDEILTAVHHYMGAELTEKMLNAKFATNVQSERSVALRLAPLFLKNIVMKYVFNRVGDRKTSTVLSNLGLVTLPEEMARYVTRMDMLLGPMSRTRVTCAAISYGGTLNLGFTRIIAESDFEREFFRNLVKLGIHVKVESNNQW
jgi:NRPS condensation-like uncharacterized protein